MNAPLATRPARRLRPGVRRAVLTVHIAASVALLGSCAAIVAIHVRAASTSHAGLAASAYELLGMFPTLFGIPLSLTALVTGVALGLGSRWGVLRYPWVAAKLVLLLSVIVVGAVVLGPQTAAMADQGSGSRALLIAASAWDVVALSVATCLSVYKPGRARDRAAVRRRVRSISVSAA